MVDDEHDLGLVKEATPFHRHHPNQEKEAWLDENRERIANRYRAQCGRDPVTEQLQVK